MSNKLLSDVIKLIITTCNVPNTKYITKLEYEENSVKSCSSWSRSVKTARIAQIYKMYLKVKVLSFFQHAVFLRPCCCTWLGGLSDRLNGDSVLQVDSQSEQYSSYNVILAGYYEILNKHHLYHNVYISDTLS